MASIETSVQALATRIGAECKALRELINGNAGDLSGLATPVKTTILAAVNNLQDQIDQLIVSAGGLVAYDFVQTTPESTWIVNHNLDRAVVAQVFDPAGNEVEVEWQQVSTNQVRVFFAAETTGSARIT